MIENKGNVVGQEWEDVNKLVDKLTLFDDEHRPMCAGDRRSIS